MKDEKDLLQKLVEHGRWITTRELDAIILEWWDKNPYNASKHCNSLMRRGLINYCNDGDWEILITSEDLDNCFEFADSKKPDYSNSGSEDYPFKYH